MEIKLGEKSIKLLNKIKDLPIGTIFSAKDIGVDGRSLTPLIKGEYIKKENNKSPFKYSYTKKEYIAPIKKISISEQNGYTKHTKGNNQYFAEYIEKAVDAIINKNEIINDTGYPFTEKDIELMNEQAHDWVKRDFPYAYKSEYLGRKTTTADCDLIINDTEHVELKYVSEGNGTYLNTSVYYFKQFGFDFHEYMQNMGYLDFLVNLFGDIVSLKNNSPMNEANSSNIRNNQTDIYKKEIIPADEKIRKTFVNDLINYFSKPEHYNDLQTFGHQMLTKETPTSHKRNPDFVSVYGYKDSIIRRIYPDQILKPNEPIVITQEKTVNRKKEPVFSIKLNKIIRVQIGWQNGTGLYNPTIRVFIDTKR